MSKRLPMGGEIVTISKFRERMLHFEIWETKCYKNWSSGGIFVANPMDFRKNLYLENKTYIRN